MTLRTCQPAPSCRSSIPAGIPRTAPRQAGRTRQERRPIPAALLPSLLIAVLSLSSVTAADLAQASPPTTSDLVSASEARMVVLRESPGKVVSVRKARRDGLDAWAVTVSRQDLSVIVGYVDRGSGLLFDWAVVQRPTARSKGR